MTIQKATGKEIQAILNHSVNVFNESTVGIYKTNLEKAKQINAPFLAHGGYYLVFKEKGNVYGWVGVGLSFDNYTDELMGVISELYVLPTQRGKGIAKKLCKAAIQQLKESGVSKIQLNVFNGNKAKKLYEELGFRDIYSTMEKKFDD